MHSYKKDFPIFFKNPDLIYLDSASTAQKPNHVIEGTKDFIETTYANIHRGIYDISEKAEDLYIASKLKFANIALGTSHANEIIYTYNGTYAFNMLAESLYYSNILKSGDSIIVDIASHHANIVPWQMLQDRHGIQIKRLELDENYEYNMADFTSKYDNTVKVVSLSAASNVTGSLYNLSSISKQLREDTMFIVDGCQAIPHSNIDVQGLRIDALVATGHKIMAETGLGILYLTKKRQKTLQAPWGGGGMIEDVTKKSFTSTSGSRKFEPGTPNITGAVSLLKALEYIESIGGYSAIHEHQKALITYALERIQQNKKISLLGKSSEDNRLGIFSLTPVGECNTTQLGEKLAMENICIRCGGHCTHPLFHTLEKNGACRISTYIYNDIEDLKKVFDALENI